MNTKFEILSKNGQKSFARVTLVPENDTDRDLLHKAYLMSFDKEDEKLLLNNLLNETVLTNGYQLFRKFDHSFNRQGEIRMYVITR